MIFHGFKFYVEKKNEYDNFKQSDWNLIADCCVCPDLFNDGFV